MITDDRGKTQLIAKQFKTPGDFLLAGFLGQHACTITASKPVQKPYMITRDDLFVKKLVKQIHLHLQE